MIVFVWMENYPLPQSGGNTHTYVYAYTCIHTHIHTPMHSCTKLPMKSLVFLQTILEYAVSQEVLKKRARNRSRALAPNPSMSGKCQSLSRVRLSVTPRTAAHQAPLSMRFPRQEYWSGLLFPSPADLPDPGIEPRSLELQVDSLPSELPEKLYRLPLCHLSPQTSHNWTKSTIKLKVPLTANTGRVFCAN